MSNNYTIKYFAALKDKTGKDLESLETDLKDPRKIYELIKDKYEFELERDQISLAVNDEFVSWDQPVKSGDQLVFITPVSGG